MEERFSEGAQPEKKEVKINYSNDEITVVWQPHLCTHSTRCFKGLPTVFNPMVRKWVNVNGAPTESIIEQVKRCPSGALSFKLNNQEEIKPI